MVLCRGVVVVVGGVCGRGGVGAGINILQKIPVVQHFDQYNSYFYLLDGACVQQKVKR